MELTGQNLVKQYPKKRALDDVSFLLREGVYGLLGPNGAGKTTLINIIAGILRPTSGTVLWDGKDIDDLDWRYRELLGFQPQTPSLYKSFRADAVSYTHLDVYKRQAVDYRFRLQLLRLEDGAVTCMSAPLPEPLKDMGESAVNLYAAGDHTFYLFYRKEQKLYRVTVN